jgi:enolase-phosphatase E1
LIDARTARVLLLDVEGTTTSVSFVYDVLFPFARARLGADARGALADTARPEDIALLREERRKEREADAPAWVAASPAQELASAADYALWLMDRDRKSTALKALQGRIWEGGYESGALRAHVYADVRPAFERCRRHGRALAIFSSGSVLAQRLLFAHTVDGDLTPLVAAYFDTTTGPKREKESYRRMAEALAVPASAILFVSDVAEELDAARAAGMAAALCVREGGAAPARGHPVLRSLDEVRF